MYIVSNEFTEAMGRCPYIARITLDGVDVIQGKAVQEIMFRGGCNSSEETILLGSAFSASVEITLNKNEVSCAIDGRELYVELGIEMASGTQWIPMGKYTAQDPSEADGVLTVTAMDALGAKFDVDYEPLQGFDFTSADGVPSVDFLTALCNRRGVEVDLKGLSPIALKGPPSGFTERQAIGFISALYGGFAIVDRCGVLKIRRYAKVDATVSPETYYEDGLQKATYEFNPGWLKCHNDVAGLSMFVGDMNAQQGINLQSIWMNQAILNRLWEQMEGFTYRPVPELSFMGNPLIDPGDILTLEDADGELVSVPVMTITHEYDGGIKTTIAAYGQIKTTDYQGPTSRTVFRNAEQAKSAAKAYTDEENQKLDQLELLKRLTKEWVDDGIYLTEEGKLAINASALKVGVLFGLLLKAGSIESLDGKIQIDLGENAEEPIFNTGISTNGLIVRADEVGASALLTIDAVRSEHGSKPYYGMVQLNSTNGKRIFRIVETFSATAQDQPVGSSLKLYSQDDSATVDAATGPGISIVGVKAGEQMACEMQANRNAAGIALKFNEELSAGFSINSLGESNLVTLKINDKTIGWRSNGDGTFTLIGQ